MGGEPHSAASTLGHCLPLLALLAACSGNPTAIELVLTTDPDLDSPQDLLAQVAIVTVTVDAPGGLAGVTAPGPLAGGGTAVDADGDGDLEVVFQAPPLAGPNLPILEIGLDRNAGRELGFRVLGFPAGASLDPANAVALGGVTAVASPGEVRRVGTPLNLLAAARPPRVILCLPPASLEPVPANLAAATVLLSTTIDPATLAVRLTAPDGHAVGLATTLDTLTYGGQGGLEERRSLLTLAFQEALLLNGTYTIEVGPGIVSSAGLRFDQDPTTPAEDAFTSSFVNLIGVGGGHPCDACTSGYVCNDTETGCLPVLDCTGGCDGPFVCDPVSGACVEDCRRFGACPAATATCDAATGLCGS